MEPGWKKTTLKWCVLTALFAYAIGMCVWATDISRTETCRKVEIEVLNASPSDTVVKSGLQELMTKFNAEIKGRPLHTIDTKRIEGYLKGLSSFETVDVSLSTKGVLYVKVRQMVPELRIFDGAESYYINKDGKRINSSVAFFRDVPIVSGHFTADYPARNILPVSRAVSRDPLMKELVAMIKFDGKDNILLVPRIKGHVINIGDTSRLAAKFDKVRTMYRKVLPYRGWETYDTINVKFRGQIVATKRDKSRPAPEAVDIADEMMEEAILQGANLDQTADSPETPDSPPLPTENVDPSPGA